jgi:hypothetical protein
MAYEFDPSTVSAVLLEDGRWQACRDFALISLAGSLKWPNAFTFRTPDAEPEFVTGPASSILAVKSKHVESIQERFERQIAQSEGVEALFQWQHYTDSKTYADAYNAQDGKCAQCGGLLDHATFQHYYDGKVLCRFAFAGCSPLQPRYGRP